jgi:hypothetical protein
MSSSQLAIKLGDHPGTFAHLLYNDAILLLPTLLSDLNPNTKLHSIWKLLNINV